MSITEAQWKADWDKIWDVTTCEGGKNISITDEVVLVPYWKAADDFEKADIRLWRDGKEDSTWASDFKMDTNGTQLTGQIGTQWFTITFHKADPNVPGDKAKLECSEGAGMLLIARNIVESLPRAGGRLGRAMAWIATRAIAGILWLYTSAVDLHNGTNTGGQPGTWSAEDGGNRNGLTITPYDVRPHVRRRRA